uniref:Uncharacterized protein n=1 Tax=Yersinia enterocolitica TaxID=630 RepID=B0RKV4_YEREN|nr:hypothetical protein [Yersinia enterocolitica]
MSVNIVRRKSLCWVVFKKRKHTVVLTVCLRGSSTNKAGRNSALSEILVLLNPLNVADSPPMNSNPLIFLKSIYRNTLKI